MNNTLGAPSFARNGSGQAGDETSKVRPMTPLNAVPGLYSLSAMILSLLFLDVSLVGGRLEGNCHFLQARPERFDVIILVNQSTQRTIRHTRTWSGFRAGRSEWVLRISIPKSARSTKSRLMASGWIATKSPMSNDWYVPRHADEIVKSCCGPPNNPRISSPEKSYDPAQPQFRIARKVVKGGSHLCAPNYCLRYRPAARQPQMIDTGMSHIGIRCIVRPAATDGDGKCS